MNTADKTSVHNGAEQSPKTCDGQNTNIEVPPQKKTEISPCYVNLHTWCWGSLFSTQADTDSIQYNTVSIVQCKRIKA